MRVATAFLFAIVLIMTRKISPRESSVTTMVYSTVVGFVVFTILAPFDWVAPTWPQVMIGFATGIIYTAVNWCIIIAYRYADASVLAPYSYFQIVFIAIVGIVAFGEVPDVWTITGIAIIMASGIYNAQQERSRRASLQRAAEAAV